MKNALELLKEKIAKEAKMTTEELNELYEAENKRDEENMMSRYRCE